MPRNYKEMTPTDLKNEKERLDKAIRSNLTDSERERLKAKRSELYSYTRYFEDLTIQ
jgi:hypothetical protein